MRLTCLACILCLTLISLTHSVRLRIPHLSWEKIVLLHMHDGAPFYSKLGAITLFNKLRYASRQSYEVAAHTPAGTHGLWAPAQCGSLGAIARGSDSECFTPRRDFAIDARAPTFGKIKLALAACVGRADYWMLWTDADALVVNQTVPLTSIIDDRFDIAMSVDWLMLNAGMMLFKCSPWTKSFLENVYAARDFDNARALDQSAFQHFIDNLPDKGAHVGYVPKHRINTYVEEYRPGDFLVHMAGKLYEATTEGATAIAHQFDVLSTVPDVKDIAAFFNMRYLLGKYSGICTREGIPGDSSCHPHDPDRLRLPEHLGAMSIPNRYRHVGMRYYWLGDWKDEYDVPDWDAKRMPFTPNDSRTAKDGATRTVTLDSYDFEEEERQAQSAAEAYFAVMTGQVDVDEAVDGAVRNAHKQGDAEGELHDVNHYSEHGGHGHDNMDEDVVIAVKHDEEQIENKDEL